MQNPLFSRSRYMHNIKHLWCVCKRATKGRRHAVAGSCAGLCLHCLQACLQALYPSAPGLDVGAPHPAVPCEVRTTVRAQAPHARRGACGAPPPDTPPTARARAASALRGGRRARERPRERDGGLAGPLRRLLPQRLGALARGAHAVQEIQQEGRGEVGSGAALLRRQRCARRQL